MDIDLSVVILCYRSGKRVYGFVERTVKLLENFVPSWELILVGNYIEGTEDDTPRIVNEIAGGDNRIKTVAVPKRGMMGWDARSGLEKASGRYICLIDGDEQMPPGDIIRVYRKISREDIDLVKTYRARRYDGIPRLLISSIYNLMMIFLFPGIKARDMNSKPKILSRNSYEKLRLRSDDWFLDAEMMIQARRHRLRIGEVPTKFYKCSYRGSFVKTSTLMEFVVNLMKARFKEFFVVREDTKGDRREK